MYVRGRFFGEGSWVHVGDRFIGFMGEFRRRVLDSFWRSKQRWHDAEYVEHLALT